MKKIFFAILSLTLFTGGLIFVAEATPGPERVIVTFDDENNQGARARLEGFGGKILHNLPLINGAVVLLPSEAVVNSASHITGIKRIEKDHIVSALKPPGACTPWPTCKDTEGPTPPPQEIPWGVSHIGATTTWGESRGAGVKVAVIDTGILENHTDLDVKGGINFVSTSWRKRVDSSKWNDDNGHGTHVAGTISALDNSYGVVGVAPEAWLYAVKVLNSHGSGYTSDVISGITWSKDNGMQIISMSLGSSVHSQAMKDAVDAAYSAGVLVIVAAGNSGDGDPLTNNVNYPAKYSSAVAVSAVDANNVVAPWSSDGAEVEVAAPGVSILSTWNDGWYNTISGTSMATPHVSGVAALILGSSATGSALDANNNGVWEVDEVRTALQSSALDLGTPGRDVFYGFGLVDAGAAVL